MSKATNIAGRLIALIKMNAMNGTFAKASYGQVLAVLEPFVQELKNLQLEDERQKARFEEALSYGQQVYELQNCLRQFCEAVKNGVQSEDQHGKVYTQQFGQAMLQYGLQLLDKKPSKKWHEPKLTQEAVDECRASCQSMEGMLSFKPCIELKSPNVVELKELAELPRGMAFLDQQDAWAEARRKFGEQYAYKSVEDYEAIVGYQMNEAFKTGFMMGRLKYKHLGSFPEDG